MTDKKETKYDYYNEFRAMFLILFAVFGFLAVKDHGLILFTLIASFILLVVVSYGEEKRLLLANHLLNFILCLYNVISLFYMVGYFFSNLRDASIYRYAFYPFITESGFRNGYIMWIFIFTLFLLIMQNGPDRPRGETYGR